jgi:Spy/CpxP family protein refolding chaperone
MRFNKAKAEQLLKEMELILVRVRAIRMNFEHSIESKKKKAA